MNNFLPLVLLLLILVLMCLLLYYFFIQQSLREISNRLSTLQPVPVPVKRRGQDTIRREQAYRHDQLALLEADLTKHPRDILTEDEIECVETARKTIKRCIDELKQSGEWIGLPFDFEWTELIERIPNVITLYRRTITAVPVVATVPVILSGEPKSPDYKKARPELTFR
jgi:hypothetical protein